MKAKCLAEIGPKAKVVELSLSEIGFIYDGSSYVRGTLNNSYRKTTGVMVRRVSGTPSTALSDMTSISQAARILCSHGAPQLAGWCIGLHALYYIVGNIVDISSVFFNIAMEQMEGFSWGRSTFLWAIFSMAMLATRGFSIS